MDVPTSPDNRSWLRGLRPLFWWLILFLILYGVRWHQRMSAGTNLLLTASVPGLASFMDVSAKLDGQDFTSGQQVHIGWHKLILTHPKGKQFTTNFFVWYGKHDWGSLKLERAAGTLAITADPPAKTVKVEGAELIKELANVTSERIAAPTDEYTVKAVYPYFIVEKTVVVGDDHQAICAFAPAVGAMQAAFGYDGARFELRRMANSQPENFILEQGKLPTIVMGLEVGQYQLRATYQGMTVNCLVGVTPNHTNQLEVEFPLGSILIETTPAGATVSDDQGNDLGVTPLALKGMPAGIWRGEVNLADYTMVMATVNVLAKQTVNFQTNLVRRSFTKAMELSDQMHQEMSGNFAPLIAAFSEAVKDDPNNAEAVAMLKKIQLAQGIMDANSKAEKGDFAGALRDGEAALAIAPENPAAQQLVADFKKNVQEQQVKAEANKRIEAAALRVSRPRDYFEKLMSETPDSTDFVEQNIKVRGEVGEIRTKLAEALGKSLMLKFTIEENTQPFVEGFMIRGKMRLLDGFRRCYLVGGQTADGEVTIRFKVFEYGWPAELALAALVSKPSEDQAMSINRSTISPGLLQIRREQGIRIVTERIQNVGAQ